MNGECSDVNLDRISPATGSVAEIDSDPQTTRKDWARSYASLGSRVLPIYEMTGVAGCACG